MLTTNMHAHKNVCPPKPQHLSHKPLCLQYDQQNETHPLTSGLFSDGQSWFWCFSKVNMFWEQRSELFTRLL